MISKMIKKPAARRFPLSRRVRVFMLAVLLLLGGCRKKPADEPASRSGFLFDTVIRLDIYGEDSEKLLNDCFSMCEDFENRLSRTKKDSEVSKINSSGGKPVTVSDDTADLIRLGLQYGELSEGRFDITIAPLSDLWNFKSKNPALPDKAHIKAAVKNIDYRTVTLSGNTVTLKNPAAAIDLGGIAKGFIADRLKDYLKAKGVAHAMINLGGNVLTVGGKPGHSTWNIGIQKPFAKQGEAVTSVPASDSSVVSSGVYERYFKIDGKIYHHILNPATGYPVENDLYSVTILSERSAEGDGLSTTCFALGLTRGMELIEQLPGTEAIFITSDEKLHYTSGIKNRN